MAEKFYFDTGISMLFDPKQPFGAWFIDKVVGKYYAKFGEKIDYTQLIRIDTKQSQLGHTRHADLLFKLIIDPAKCKMALEAQSGYDSEISMRQLKYSLQEATQLPGHYNLESYLLPDMFLIYTQDCKGSNVTERVLNLKLNHQDINISYPVINLFDVIPFYRELVTGKDDAAKSEAFGNLVMQIPDLERTGSAFDTINMALSILAQRDAYTDEGADKEGVVRTMSNFVGDGLTIAQREYRNGYQSGVVESNKTFIEKLRTAFGWTEEQAKHFLDTNEKPDEPSNHTGLKTMSLQ